MLLRDQELAKIKIRKEDVELIVSNFVGYCKGYCFP